jgi:hypothetical protein
MDDEALQFALSDVLERIKTLQKQASKRAVERKTARDLQRYLEMKIIDAGYRALAAKLHPDIGGTGEAMARLTAARDELRFVKTELPPSKGWAICPALPITSIRGISGECIDQRGRRR